MMTFLFRRVAAGLLALCLLPVTSFASVTVSGPHSQSGYTCTTCHTVHTSLTGSAGYNNICLDCHRPGVPLGGNRPFVNADAADPFNRYTANRPSVMYQNSHRWEGTDTVPAAGAQPAVTGSLYCSRCHNQHSNANGKYLRTANDTDQICTDCHNARNVTSHTSGSHPVHVSYSTVYKNNTGAYRQTPLNTNPANSSSDLNNYLNNGKVLCSTCHGVHYSDSNSYTFDNASSAIFNRLSTSDGNLLRTGMRGTTVAYSTQPDPINICTNCHKGKKNHNLHSQDIQCADCHGAHVDYDAENPSSAKNVYLVRRYMTYSSSLGKNRKVLLQTTDSTRTYRNASGTGVCQACHNIPNTVNAHDAANPDTATYCNDCHEHSGQFGSFSGGCSTCHGYPPTADTPGGHYGYAVGYSGVNESTSPHGKHAAGSTNYSFTCDECHKGNNHASATPSFQDVFTVKSGIIAGTGAAYDTTTRTCSTMYCHSNGAGTTTPVVWGDVHLDCGGCHNKAGDSSWSGSAPHLKHVTTYAANTNITCNSCHALTATNSSTISDKSKHVNTTKDVSFNAFADGSWNGTQCSATYCHSNGAGSSHSAMTWSAATLNCGSCHNKAGDATWSGSSPHLKHVTTTIITAAITCNACHASTASDNSTISSFTNHINKTKDVSFNSIANTGASWSASQCSNTYCHSNGTSTASPVHAAIPWSGTISGCTSCHGGISSTGSQALSGAHRSHMTNFTTLGRGNGYTCTDCHASTVSSPDAIVNRTLHVNSFKNLSGARVPRSTSITTCANSYCHSSGKKGVIPATVEPAAPAWTDTLNCKGCHGARAVGSAGVEFNSVDGEPNYTSGGENVATSNSHLKHVQAIGIADTTECADCHYKTVDPDIPGKLKNYSGGVYHLNGAINVVFKLKGGMTGSYDTSNKTCNLTYCHGGTFTKAWGGTGLTCASCHYASNTVGSRLSGAHWLHYSSNLLPSKFSNFSGNVSSATAYRFTCSSCHADGLGKTMHADGPMNANGVAQVFYGVTTNSIKGAAYNYNTVSAGSDNGYSWTNGGSTSCNTTYCHSNGVSGAGYAAGTAVTWNSSKTAPSIRCGKCHALAASLSTGKHQKHVTTYSYSCPACHTATVSDNLTISDRLNHVNKIKDISFGAATPNSSNGVWSGSTCANTYCHSNGLTTSHTGVAWTTTLDCGGCHNKSGDASWSGSSPHLKHVTTYQTNSLITCETCHLQTATSSSAIKDVSKHVNALKEVNFNTATINGLWSGTQCSNTYCHSNGTTSTAPVHANISWSGTLSCTGCHGASNSGTLTAPHASHTDNAAVLGANFDCIDCHAKTVNISNEISNKAQHVNKLVDYSGAKAGGSASYNSTTKVCSISYCHSNGKGIAANTPTWGSATTLGCNGCHGLTTTTGAPDYANGGSGVASSNSHAAHIPYSSAWTHKVRCNDCHADTVNQAGTGIITPNGQKHVNQSIDVVWNSSNPSAHFDYNNTPGIKTCSNITCHGTASSPAATAQWGDSGCAVCHTATVADPVFMTTNWTSLKGTKAGKIVYATWTSSGHGKRNGNYRGSNNPPAGLSGPSGCEYCHDPAISHDSTGTNPIRLRNINGTWGLNGVCQACHAKGGTTVTIGSLPAVAVQTRISSYHFGDKHISSNTGGQWCWDCHNPHGDTRNIFMINSSVSKTSASNGSPNSMKKTTFTFANPASPTGTDYVTAGTNITPPSTKICQTCHGFGLNSYYDETNAYQTNGSEHNIGTRCTNCHNHNGPDKVAAFKGLGDCISCHSITQTGGRRIITGASGDFVKTSHHVTNGTATEIASINSCKVCHGDILTDRSHPNGSPADPNVDLLDPDTNSTYVANTPAGVEQVCAKCHDSNGVARTTPALPAGSTASQPFKTAGDTNSPVNISWTPASMGHSYRASPAGGGCLGCHSNSHGNSNAKMLTWTYNSASAQTFCYNCHGTSTAGGAQTSIQPLFAKTRNHSVESCNNCHSPHQAKPGTHVVGTTTGNKAGGVLNGVAGAQLTTNPAFWTAPVSGNFTAKTIVSGTDVEATLCFKCHTVYSGSGTYNVNSPSGTYPMTDIAKEFNPNNVGNFAGTWASGETAGGFHPVLGTAGSNLGAVSLNNLVTTNISWNTTSSNLMTCSDCHGSATTTDPLGPHGSAANFLLRGPNTTWNNTIALNGSNQVAGVFCWNCHSPSYSSSRFPDHTKSDHKIQCFKCHAAVPHGGPRPGMLVSPAGADTAVGGTISGWDTTSPYYQTTVTTPGSNRLYIKSYPANNTIDWVESDCGCNSTNH